MIVTAVADAAGVEPASLSPPLYDVVAPDAIEALFADDGRATSKSLSFEYDEFAVTVVGRGDEIVVDVQPLSKAPSVAPESD